MISCAFNSYDLRDSGVTKSESRLPRRQRCILKKIQTSQKQNFNDHGIMAEISIRYKIKFFLRSLDVESKVCSYLIF